MTRPDGEPSGPGEITIRTARRSDLGELLPLHREAFENSMGVQLGDPYLRHFLLRFIGEDDALSYVAVRDDVIVGYVFGAPLSAAGRTTKITGPWAVLGLIRHPRLLARRAVLNEVARRLGRGKAPADPETPLAPPTCSLVGIGVAGAARGQRVGGRLMDAFEERARTLRCVTVRLSVYKDNASARTLYERQGWRPFVHPTNDAVVYYGRELGAPSA